MVQRASPVYVEAKAESSLQHYRYEGGHDMTPERFYQVVEWLVAAGVDDSMP
jgi:hypothetical protein